MTKRRKLILLTMVAFIGLPALVVLRPVVAQSENSSQQGLPDPAVFARPDAVSVIVARARSDQPGLRQLFNTALAGSPENQTGTSVASLLSGFLSPKSQQSLVMAALPLQWVRLDVQEPKERLLSTTCLTVTGWRGVQGMVYGSMLEGTAETRHHRGEEIVLREGWKNPDDLKVMARTRGSFLNCSTPELAATAIDRLLDNLHPPVQTPLWRAYSQLNQSKDLFGVARNQKGSLLKLVAWAGQSVQERIRHKVGSQRFERVVNSVSLVSWEAEVVSDDQISLEMQFATIHPSQVPELEQLWREVRSALNSEGRVGSFRTRSQPSGLVVEVSIVGFRPDVSRFLSTLKL